MAEPFPARTVVVDTIRRARCTFCQWTGADQENYARANAEREAHLTWHRLGCPDPEVAGQVADRDAELASRRRVTQGAGGA